MSTAGRGDATRPDPKQVIRSAIFDVRHRDHQSLTTDCEKQVERDLAPLWHQWGDVLEAAAGVIVADTAEQIAAAIEAVGKQFPGAGATYLRDCYMNAAAIARGFAAAGAGEGEGSDHE